VAATRIVSAAAASTAQCAVIRRVASGPRGLITRTAFARNHNVQVVIKLIFRERLYVCKLAISAAQSSFQL
jgi:hypothetical protein